MRAHGLSMTCRMRASARRAAVNTNQVKPVALKGPTVLADNDPYNAVRST
jgi:hypothetical protein